MSSVDLNINSRTVSCPAVYIPHEITNNDYLANLYFTPKKTTPARQIAAAIGRIGAVSPVLSEVPSVAKTTGDRLLNVTMHSPSVTESGVIFSHCFVSSGRWNTVIFIPALNALLWNLTVIVS